MAGLSSTTKKRGCIDRISSATDSSNGRNGLNFDIFYYSRDITLFIKISLISRRRFAGHKRRQFLPGEWFSYVVKHLPMRAGCFQDIGGYWRYMILVGHGNHPDFSSFLTLFDHISNQKLRGWHIQFP